MSNLLGRMLSEAINSLSNLSCLEGGRETQLVQKLYNSKNSKTKKQLTQFQNHQANSKTKTEDSIKPLEYPQSEPSIQASSMSQITLNQTAERMNKIKH